MSLSALIILTIPFSFSAFASNSFLTENLPKSFKYATKVKGKPSAICSRADKAAIKYISLSKVTTKKDHTENLKLSNPPLKFLKSNCKMFITNPNIKKLSRSLSEQKKYFRVNKERPPIPNYSMNPYN